jgi:superfamily II DNA or RNA helicase
MDRKKIIIKKKYNEVTVNNTTIIKKQKQDVNDDTYNGLVLFIKESIKKNISLPDILKNETYKDKEVKRQLVEIYNKLIMDTIDNTEASEADNSISIEDLWNTLRSYQKEYINEAVSKMLDTIKNHKKCIVKSPTGSGKTVMLFWIIAKLYIALGSLDKFNILLLTPRLKLCSQSIKDNKDYKDKRNNINILRAHTINANFMLYDAKNKYKTEYILINNKTKSSCINFISSTYQSMSNLVVFLNQETIKINISICDEFHFINSWDKNTVKNDKFIKSPCIEYTLNTSATPYHSQEIKTDLYGELIDKVKVKELIEKGFLCPLVPLVEIDNDIPQTPEECELYEAYGKYYKLPQMVKEVFTTYNKKKGILFCNDTSNCWEIYELFKAKKDVLGNIKLFQPYVSTKIMKHKKEDLKNDSIKDSSVKDSSIENNKDNEINYEDTLLDEAEIQNIELILEEYENCNEPCILITCKKIDIGYDHAPIDCVIIADNKASIIDIAQAIGRGLRTCEGYENKVCHVLIPVRVKDINDNNFKSIKSYLEYIKNDVGINIESYIREQIKKQKAKQKGNKYIQLNNDFDNSVDYNKMKFISDSWIKIYDNLSILTDGKNKKRLQYDILFDAIKQIKFTHKNDYKQWASTNKAEEHPEVYFKNNGWANYYQFLRIDTSMYPETFDELKAKCITHSIKTFEEYETNSKELNLPSMSEELYGQKICFTNGEICIDTIYLTKDEILKWTVIRKSNILYCKIYNSEFNDTFENEKYSKILHYLYEKTDRKLLLKNMIHSYKTEIYNLCGFKYYEKLNLSIVGCNAKTTLKEICNMVEINKFNMEIQIKKENNEIVNFKM